MDVGCGSYAERIAWMVASGESKDWIQNNNWVAGQWCIICCLYFSGYLHKFHKMESHLLWDIYLLGFILLTHSELANNIMEAQFQKYYRNMAIIIT